MKKLISLILAAMMILSLCACGNKKDAESINVAPQTTEEPQKAQKDELPASSPQQPSPTTPAPTPEPTPDVTAENLVMNGRIENVDSIELNMTLDFSATIDASAMLELEEDEVPEGQSMAMKMGTTVNCDIEAAKLENDSNVTHMKGDIGVQMFGMEYTDTMESYFINHEDGSQRSYDWDSQSGSWTYTDSDTGTDRDEGMSGFVAMTAMEPSVIQNLELLPYTEGDDIYTVTGSVSVADLCRSCGMTEEELFSMTGSDAEVPEDMRFDMVFTYDVETKRMKAMYLDLNTFDEAAQKQAPDTVIDQFTLNFIIYSVNETTVSVPAEVLAAATPAIEDDWDFGAEDLPAEYEIGDQNVA